jgi:hypothetical protein
MGGGVADDTAAIQAAVKKGGSVYLPAGRYRITAPITVADRSVIILGDGPGLTQILCATPTAGFAFSLDNSLSEKIVFRFVDLDMVLATGEWVGGGTAISVVGSARYPYWQGTSQLYVERVRVLSSTQDSSRENWTNALYIKNIAYPVIRDFCWMALNTLDGTGINVDNDPSSAAMTATFGLLIDRPIMQGGGAGIRVTGAIEGIHIYPYALVNQRVPIFVDGALGPTGQTNVVHIKGGDMAALGAETIHVRNAKNVCLQGIDIFKYGGDSDVVLLENVVECNISGNKIGTGTMTTGNQLLHLSRSQHVVVTGNNFAGEAPTGGIGINEGGEVLVCGNNLRSVSGPVAQAFYVANTDKVTIRGNVDSGWATQFGGGANGNFVMTADNLHY